MTQEIQSLLDGYLTWLRDNTTLRRIDDWVEITTPYLDRHNDYLQIYAKRENGGYILSDDGYIIEDLEQSGCRLDGAKRQGLLKMTLGGFGVQLHDNRLEVRASASSFASRKHNLLQAMLAVNDLFYLASPIVANVFFEDVVSWLDLNEIRYTPKIKFTGNTGYDHLFDFVIPKSRTQPERIMKSINRLSRDTAEALAFAWHDTRDVRPRDSRAYALLNDTDNELPPNALEALRSYEVKAIAWSQRDSALPELVA